MAHKIFGYKGFVVKVIPREVITGKSAASRCIRYAASVVIMRFTGASRQKYEMRCYPGGICVTRERALELGTDYATHVIDDDFSNASVTEQQASFS
ncbi:MAG: hypothetical protein WBR15_02365 [Gammaproteobacteria bacterium]